MSDFHDQKIENNSIVVIKHLETSSEKNLQVLSMEDAAMINECIQGIEIKNDTETCSKETMLPLEIEETPTDMTDDCKHRTENLISDQHELRMKTSSRSFRRLTNQQGNDEKNEKDGKINQQIQTEVIVSRIIDRTRSNCSVCTGKSKKNNNDISRKDSSIQQYESTKDINKVVTPEKGIKRANSNPSTLNILTKRAKSSPPAIISKSKYGKIVKLTSTFSTEFKFNTNSTLQCMESLISRRRIIYKKRQEARDKLAKIEYEALNNIRKHKKKKVRRCPRTKKLNPTRKVQQSKNNNHNQFKKPYSTQESDITYYSSSVFCNKNHDFNQGNKCLPKQYAAKIINEKKKRSWCTIM